MGHWRWCTWIGYIHLLILVGGTQAGSYENYTVVREGHSCLITLKMPLNEDFKVMGPGNKTIFKVNTRGVHSDWVYILNSYRTRVNITKITRSADSVILQFWLHNATSEDAGRYHCSTWTDGPIPNCQHMLYVQGQPAHPNIRVIVNTTNIVLTCKTNSSIEHVDHDLRMIYTWRRNGQEVEVGERFNASGQTLTVTDVKKEDLGNYSCKSTEEGLASNWSDTVDLHMLANFQQPYIAAPETTHMDRSVTLSCFSVFKLYSPVDVKLMLLMNWRRNGIPVNDRITYNVNQKSHARKTGIRYHRSTLTVSDVSAAKGDNFQCQVVVGPRAELGWSEVYAPVKQSGSFENYTVVREGHSASIIWKMPLVHGDFLVLAPRFGVLFAVNSVVVYISDAYRTRVNIVNMTTSAESIILQFWLHNSTSEDAGTYHCSKLNDDPSPNCHHMLYVQGQPADANISVIVNTTNIVLTCEINSSIVPVDHDLGMIYTWKRNGQEVEVGERFNASGQTLAVTDVKKEDLGNYTCQSTEEGLASNWSDTVDLHMLAKLEVGELTVNGTVHTTVKENEVVLFRCMVEGPPFPAVSLIRNNSLATVNMSRTQQNVYEHVMVVRKCSQLGVYSCRATNVAGASEDEQRTVVLNGMPREQASHVLVTNEKTPSVIINITLCSHPAPSKPKLGLTRTGSLRDITDIKNFYLTTRNMTNNVFEYSLIVNNDITSADFGAYIFSVEYNDRRQNFMILSSKPDTPETNLPLVAGSSVAAVIVTLGIIAGMILSRLNRLRDYWNLRFRSYVTPIQIMTENIDDGEYAEIDDADLLDLGAGNIVQPVGDVPGDNNIPPPCGARHRRERQQLEGEDDEYEEARSLDATNTEEHPTEQETKAEMHQPDLDILEDIKDEMVMTLHCSHTHSEPRIFDADWAAGGRESGHMAAAITDQFQETSFMTQEPDETDTDKLPTISGIYSGIDGITAIKAEEDDPLEEGREDYVESEPLDLPCNRYENLMPHQPRDTYTALDNDDDITHD
ncbi:hemicentin-1-like [Haliotis rubra]|uniref:hemicentin-1-like n=1 Tax=Haliotis rubra TaxID=36100 RepID=UPI001EE5AC84|nr:hemicentin-1-like [Haliotis rubra]